MVSIACNPMAAVSMETIAPRSAFVATHAVSATRLSLATRTNRFSVRASVESETPPAAPTEAAPIPNNPVDQAAAAMGAPKGVRVNPSGAATSVFEGGKAQETINGRAAMIGFISAVGAELSTGDSIVQQLTLKGGLPLLLVPATFAAILVGSFAPRVFDVKENGLDTPAKPYGPFTPAVELLNGRAAMIGFAALLIIEGIKGSALF